MPLSEKPYPVPEDEPARLQELFSYDLLDTPPEEDLDRLVRLASRLFDVPISLISLVDEERQFFKARVGLGVSETHRSLSFCGHAVAKGEILVVGDAREDPRFTDNDLVTGEPGIRFYAGAPLVTPSGRSIGTLCVIDDKPRLSLSDADREILRDLAELTMARLELRRLEAGRQVGQQRFRQIAATSPDAIVCTDEAGRITFWNRAAENIFGYRESDIRGQSFDRLVPDGARDAYRFAIEQAVLGHVPPRLLGRTTEVIGLRRNGTQFPLELSLCTWTDGDARAFGAIVRDITERRSAEDRLYRLARLDPITELANRETFTGVLEAQIAVRRPLALLVFDLDGFKEVNDSLGHEAGDTVLRTIAHRLQTAFPDALIISRASSDEFSVLLGTEAIRSDIAIRVRSAIGLLAHPISTEHHDFTMGAGVGAAIYPDDGPDCKSLVANVGLALYEAKKAGRNALRFYVPSLRSEMDARKGLESELARAAAQGEFELFYQPQVQLATGCIVGAEALLRWRHPVRGLLAPVEFIRVLETSAVAADVGTWILRTACAQAARWRAAGARQFRVAVNLFSVQLQSPHLVSWVNDALASTGLPPDGLELEITENTLVAENSALLDSLRRLKSAGVGIAFDDYGTGYASLSLLKRLPITRLKIDRSFISNVVIDEGDAAVVRAILYLGRSFQLQVVAEGVETAEQEAFLQANGCDEAQGYLYGRPIPAAQWESWSAP